MSQFYLEGLLKIAGDYEGASSKMVMFGHILPLYRILQIVHCLDTSDFNQEVGRFTENPTEKLKPAVGTP